MEVYSTTSFRDELQKLQKKPKDGYQACAADICKRLLALTDQEIDIIGTNLFVKAGLKLKKIRIEGVSKGKSGGYRLLAISEILKQRLTLVFVHPKQGPHKLDDVGENTLKRLLIEFIEEDDQKELVKLDLTNELNVFEEQELLPEDTVSLEIADNQSASEAGE